ncbi:MAG: hypothetical protein KAW47_03645 [Thermoplasmatales archaeon]|nr:hypothetical protein [Thermoplasmatales archaeon]
MDVRSNMLAGVIPEDIVNCVSVMIENNKEWKNPFGDGTSGKKIVDIVLRSR